MKSGTTWILLGLGALVLWSRRSSAASAPIPGGPVAEREGVMVTTSGSWRGTRADVEAGIRDAEADMPVDQARSVEVLARWGDLFGRFPRPLPPQLLALVVARESGGDPNAVSGDATLGEKGLMQLSNDEARACGVSDPFNPDLAVPGAQQLYRAAMRTYGEPDAESQLLTALLSRSIGLGDTRRLRAVVPAVVGMTFAQRLRMWLEDHAQGMPTTLAGRVTARQFARRVYRGILRAEQSVLLGWVSADADLRTA